jgi:hypothetical protein
MQPMFGSGQWNSPANESLRVRSERPSWSEVQEYVQVEFAILRTEWFVDLWWFNGFV